jgi:hypothetical protein
MQHILKECVYNTGSSEAIRPKKSALLLAIRKSVSLNRNSDNPAIFA